MPGRACRGLVGLMISAGLAGCGRPVSYWPPAVTSAHEIRALPVTQRDLRGIGLCDADIRLITVRFRDLDYLYLNSQTKVSDAGVAHLQRCEKLRQVVIMDGGGLTDAGVRMLADLPGMRELMIERAPKLTDATLRFLGQKTRLQIIHLIQCPGLSDAAKARLREVLPGCEIHFANVEVAGR
jgi:hypothetical protein